MNWFKNSVKTRLLVLVTILISGISILFLQGISALYSVEHASNVVGDGKDIVADILPPPLYLIEAHLTANELLQSTESQKSELIEVLRQLRKDYNERNLYWKQKSSEIDDIVIDSLFGEEKEKADAYWMLLEEKFIPSILAGDIPLAKHTLEALKVIYSEHRVGVDKTVKLANAWSNTRNTELESTIKSANYLFPIVAVISVVLGIFVAALTLRTIITPVTELERSIRQIEQTLDFTVQVRVHGHDEIGNTTISFNKLLKTIQNGFQRIQDHVTHVSDAASGLSHAAKQLAQSSAQQSESTSAVAATIEEVTTSIHHIAENACDAEKASLASGNLSKEGGTVIRHATSEMAHIADMIQKISKSIEDLSSQSTQISHVTQVIKQVADQTSLLALNAAIEAARAGEQGRGFAVVADEVRKLAEQTTRATEEISTIITTVEGSAKLAVTAMSGSVQQAQEGIVLAEKAGNAIQTIEGGVKDVIGLVNEISSALSEQSAASTEMAQHIEKVALMTEENNSAAVNIAAASNELEELANQMHEVVHKFKI